MNFCSVQSTIRHLNFDKVTLKMHTVSGYSSNFFYLKNVCMVVLINIKIFIYAALGNISNLLDMSTIVYSLSSVVSFSFSFFLFFLLRVSYAF